MRQMEENMAYFNGKYYTKQDLIRRVNNMKNIAEVRPQTRTSGKASGVKMLDITCGELSYSVMEGRCMDIANARYKGIPYNFLTKVGPVHPSQADHRGMNFVRSITGGMLYTAGLSNVGGHYFSEGEGESPFHGRIRFVPADNVSVIEKWDGDDYIVGAGGEMRDNGIFFENCVLRREITSRLGEKSITVRDEVENESWYNAPFMFMYHINVGFPVLGAGAKVYVSSKSVQLNSASPEEKLGTWQEVMEPVDNYPECVYCHELYHDEDGFSYAGVYNHENHLGLWIRFPHAVLPKLIEWCSFGSTDYCVGIMPSNGYASGRQKEIDEGTLMYLEPFRCVRPGVELHFMDCEEDFAEFTAKLEKCTL